MRAALGEDHVFEPDVIENEEYRRRKDYFEKDVPNCCQVRLQRLVMRWFRVFFPFCTLRCPT